MSGSTLIPSFRYKDAHAAIEWLETVLGFVRHAVYDGPDGTVAHAQMTFGKTGMLMLGSASNANDHPERNAVPAEIAGRVTSPMYLVVEDCGPLYAKAKAAGAEFLQELKTMDYGGSAFTVCDPEGYVWSVGEYDPWVSGVTKEVAMSGVPYAEALGGLDPEAVIAETPVRLARVLDGVSAEDAKVRPAPGKWCLREVMAHLADCEIAWSWRLRVAFEKERAEMQPFDQDPWAKMYGQYTMEMAKATFYALRAWNVAFVAGLSEADKAKKIFHPERGEETLWTLVEIMAGHDLHHLKTLGAVRAALLAAVGWMAAASPAWAYVKPCPAVIGVAANGSFYEERGGAWVRQSPKTVEEIVIGGCYPEGGPSPTSSVLLEVASGAPKARIELMYSILERSGWQREKVKVVAWKNAPRRPTNF